MSRIFLVGGVVGAVGDRRNLRNTASSSAWREAVDLDQRAFLTAHADCVDAHARFRSGLGDLHRAARILPVRQQQMTADEWSSIWSIAASIRRRSPGRRLPVDGDAPPAALSAVKIPCPRRAALRAEAFNRTEPVRSCAAAATSPPG